MNPTEAVKKLKGTETEKRALLDYFINKAMNEQLEEWEVIMVETLKKDLIPPEKKVVGLSASMKGTAIARI